MKLRIQRSSYQPADSNSGVALVITLILLAVITTLAIAFLAITRRETVAVGSMSHTTDAEMAADSALERAKAEILAVYPARNQTNVVPRATNILGPDMFVSVCCHNYVPDPSDPRDPSKARVFRYNREVPDQRLSFAYDAAPPVFVDTNRTGQPGPRGPLDDRFYVDLNRNGAFEETGNVTNTVNGAGNGPGGFAIDPAGGIEWRVGDPQWIGVLRNPRRPLSADNPFIARYAFMVLPAGRSLDVNWIHNDAKITRDPSVGESWYSRNQGVGGYEINLAAFFSDLNANAWNDVNPPYRAATYLFDSDAANFSRGTSFDNAWDVLSFRIGGTKANMNNLYELFDARTVPQRAQVDAAFMNDGIDTYARNPPVGADLDAPAQVWSGSDSTNRFHTPHDFLTKISSLSNRLDLVSRQGNSYDRYTFYRMLAQLGTDTAEGEDDGKININYVNVSSWLPNGPRVLASDLVPWTTNSSVIQVPRLGGAVDMGRPVPEIFFLTVVTNLLAREPEFASFVTNRIGRSILSIPIYTNQARAVDPPNYSTYTTNLPVNGPLYSARLHQLLQIAANILEATSSSKVGEAYPQFPWVFRPRFYTSPDGNAFITNYTLVDPVTAPVNTMLATRWVDLDSGGTIRNDDDLVYGIPMIFGARSGLPAFNEFGLVSMAQATRKLKVTRSTSGREWDKLEQQFEMNIKTMLQIEARNPNTNPYPRRLELVVQSQAGAVVRQFTNSSVWLSTNWFAGSTNIVLPFKWRGEKVGNDRATGTNDSGLILTTLLTTNLLNYVVFTNADGVQPTNHQWTLALTNRLVFYLIDRASPLDPNGRLIDMVTLSRPHQVLGIGDEMERPQNAGSTALNWIWSSARQSNTTVGVRRQLEVSSGYYGVADGVWGNYDGNTVLSKTDAAKKFGEFMNKDNWDKLGTNQAPFTPTRTMVQANYYQVNDPFVHYTFEDLRDDPIKRVPLTTEPLTSLGARTNLTASIQGNNPEASGWNNGDFSIEDNGVIPGEGRLDPTIRDPGIIHPSRWNFPTNLFPNIGWLGRVHRGTPWQTIYLKSRPLSASADWIEHTGNQRGIHPYSASRMVPQRDWDLLDLFTTAPHPNAARGRLSVNQTNQAAWSALLSGIQASIPVPDAEDGFVAAGSTNIHPTGVTPALIPDAVLKIAQSINTNRTRFGSNVYNPRGQFLQIGQILAAPELSDDSPYLKSKLALFDPFAPAGNARIYDEDYERIPQQILSLLKVGEPKFVIYAWGQSLKPARAGVQLNGTRAIPGPLSGPSINVDGDRLVNNYQITGETATKAVVRVVFPERLPPPPVGDGGIDYRRPKLVVESFNVIDVE